MMAPPVTKHGLCFHRMPVSNSTNWSFRFSCLRFLRRLSLPVREAWDLRSTSLPTSTVGGPTVLPLGPSMVAGDLLPTRLLFDSAVSGTGSLQTLVDCIEVCCATQQTGLYERDAASPSPLIATVHTAVEEAIVLLVAQTSGALDKLGRRELRRALTKVCLSVARANGDPNKGGDTPVLTSPLASPGLDKLRGLREHGEGNSVFALLEQFTLRVATP
eukprot:m.1586232 g.1586232  ORF g.1586232 m.1586232 type:complete len:217 (+) comp25327_c0_seq18:288-938(+)